MGDNSHSIKGASMPLMYQHAGGSNQARTPNSVLWKQLGGATSPG
ncbi:hypothetical protein LC55x_5398 [Lysobacter capsici]|nr:hypothetical protein LC55x_5398 [Lysobacter capsici]